MPAYPGSPTLTVHALLKSPRTLSRNLTNLASKRFVADRLLARGTPEMVAGGAAVYQQSENIYPDRNVQEVGVRAEFPRAGWTEAIFTAAVHKYGLEIPISFESIRRNQLDQVARAQRKLANAIVKFVDGVTMTMLLAAGSGLLTGAASGDWTTAATDIAADIAKAKQAIYDQDEGYDPDTIVLNSAQELDLLSDKDIRDAMPRETSSSTVQTGRAPLVMGIRQMLVTNSLTAGKVIVAESKTLGTIADERPEPGEGYQGYDPGDDKATVFVKIYDEDKTDDRVVRCARWPAMWIAEPKAGYIITGA
jgi:hypothetical protein